MKFLLIHHRDLCLVLALLAGIAFGLLTGCDGSAPNPSGGDAAESTTNNVAVVERWQVEWNAVKGASGYLVMVDGITQATTEPTAIVQARRGQIVSVAATDGDRRSASSSIVLGN